MYSFIVNYLILGIPLFSIPAEVIGVQPGIEPTTSYGGGPIKACKDTDWQCLTSGQCLDFNHVCNRVADCPDGSDEGPQLCDESFTEAPIDSRGRATTDPSHAFHTQVPEPNMSDQQNFRREAMVRTGTEPGNGEEGIPLSSIPEIMFLGWFPNRGNSSAGSEGLIVQEKESVATPTQPVTPRPTDVSPSSALQALRTLIRSIPGRQVGRTLSDIVPTTGTMMSQPFPRLHTTSPPPPLTTTRASVTARESKSKNCVLDARHKDFCRRMYRGYYPHPDQCDQYIVCEWGYSHVCFCPKLTVWDAGLMTCIWEYQSGPCNKQPPVNTALPSYNTFPATTTSPPIKTTSLPQTLHPFLRALFSAPSDSIISGRLPPQQGFRTVTPAPSNPSRPLVKVQFTNNPDLKLSQSRSRSFGGARGDVQWLRSPELSRQATSTTEDRFWRTEVPLLSNFFETGGIRKTFNNRNQSRNKAS